MKIRFLTLCLALFALVATTSLSAQIQSPPASPTVKMETTVGLTDLHVEYSRPSMKGRTLFAADGLVPYGEVWRTGANQATKVTFGKKVMVAGKEVPAGSYAVLTKPTANNWEVMFFPYESGSWNSYVEMEPAVTVMADVKKTGMPVETFTIDVANYTMDGADIVMMWGNTMVALPVVSTAKEDVMASIERTMAGPSLNDYYNAASFLGDSGDNKKALEYIKKANMMSGDSPKFWMVRREAVILGELGMKKEAIEAAKKSMELAKEAGNMDYVRMNEKSLKEWMK